MVCIANADAGRLLRAVVLRVDPCHLILAYLAVWTRVVGSNGYRDLG